MFNIVMKIRDVKKIQRYTVSSDEMKRFLIALAHGRYGVMTEINITSATVPVFDDLDQKSQDALGKKNA